MTIIDAAYQLGDRFGRNSGRIYATGWDALVRLPLMQRQRDQAAGLETAGFVSGYPGSPLGGLDSLFRSQRAMLAENHIHFEPGLNEDLAATSVWGSQHVGGASGVASACQGVFGLWYGKGPGVERSTDAMRTGNVNGVSQFGGVLALAGDDHDARSTVTAQQSETLFMHMHMPVLNPATVQDYIDFGLAGWALSRFSRSWVGMICLNDTADSSASVEVNPLRPHLIVPGDAPDIPPFGTLRVGGVMGGAALEREIRGLRLPAAQRFVRANRLDYEAFGSRRQELGRHGLGIVASGKAYLDVLEGLERLGLDRERAAALGISVYKVAMPWPLDPEGILEFATGLREVLVFEPKHPIMEDQLGRYLRQLPVDRRPELVGKTDGSGFSLVTDAGGLDASIASAVVFNRLQHLVDIDSTGLSLPRERASLLPIVVSGGSEPVRTAGFCSGCPHNTSTLVPAGSFALGGTGCHGMAIGMDERDRPTRFFTHMGGEGALWIGMAPFTNDKHVFQNLGDGTYSHSGALAIRASVAANISITFKVLLNGYISMTGGQAIPGGLTAQALAAQVLAEGVKKVVVVSDDPAKYRAQLSFPAGVKVHDRTQLLVVEDELRSVQGVTVLIYDQVCAAELRRERRKGRAEDPDRRVFINEAVCEGCGDCNATSNCISVEPLETDLGRKRTIDQSSCNKDFSCLGGYCPSFVTLRGATPRRRLGSLTETTLNAHLPDPPIMAADIPYNIVVGGIGGGGVLTIGALLGMAAHIEGRSVTVLNESGLAQKNGAVQSHIRICTDPASQEAARIGRQMADLVIAADLVVAARADVIATMDAKRTSAIVDARVRPTAAFARDGSLDFSAAPFTKRLIQATGGRVHTVDATESAMKLMGDSIYANVLLLGYAAQLGLLPVSVQALERAVEINGVSVERNLEALRLGRLESQGLVHREVSPVMHDAAGAETLDSLISRRKKFLVDYQGHRYASRYHRSLRAVIAAERNCTPDRDSLGRAATEGLFKLMAYKDEYEVARLYTAPEFRHRLVEAFEGDFRWSVNLAPQIFNRRDLRTGRAAKWEIPSWVIMPIFRALTICRFLRGTPFDFFGRTTHRRAERSRIAEYESLLSEIAECLSLSNYAIATQLAALPQEIKGYDTVKDESAAGVTKRQAALLEQLHHQSLERERQAAQS